MRLVVAAILGSLLVSPIGGDQIERALAVARGRESDRQQFHRRYVIDLQNQTVTQIEVITEFRRLVLIAEEHTFRGDWMFTRGRRAAEDAIKPFQGVVTLKARVRFSPLNTFIESPPYALAVDDGAVDTQLSPEYSTPVKTKDRRTLSSLTGVALEATVPAALFGQRMKTVGVLLDGKDQGHVPCDFARLD